jgi:hypothetical protein
MVCIFAQDYLVLHNDVKVGVLLRDSQNNDLGLFVVVRIDVSLVLADHAATNSVADFSLVDNFSRSRMSFGNNSSQFELNKCSLQEKSPSLDDVESVNYRPIRPTRYVFKNLFKQLPIIICGARRGKAGLVGARPG